MVADSTNNPTSNKQTIATVSALVLGVAGALGWVKPPDTSAAAQTYDATKGAIEALEDKHDEDFDALEDRQREFELWAAKRLAEIDRDKLPENRVEPVEPESHWQPPPRAKRPPPKPARDKLPPAAELLK
jgi:uncharacterized Ntn-hydrolase superfamily protein